MFFSPSRSFLYNALQVTHLSSNQPKATNDLPLMVRGLYEFGAGLEVRAEAGETALILALDCECGEAARELIRLGCDVSVKGGELRTPLMLACMSVTDSAKSVRALLSAGAVIDARDSSLKTALTFSARNPRPGALTLLLEAGADLSSVDNQVPLSFFSSSSSFLSFFREYPL